MADLPEIAIAPCDQQTITLLVTQMPIWENGQERWALKLSPLGGDARAELRTGCAVHYVFRLTAADNALLDGLQFAPITAPDGTVHCGVYTPARTGISTAFAEGRKAAVLINQCTGDKGVVYPYTVKVVDAQGNVLAFDPGQGNDGDPTFP